MNLPTKQRKPRETKLPTHPASLPSALDDVFTPPVALKVWGRGDCAMCESCPRCGSVWQAGAVRCHGLGCSYRLGEPVQEHVADEIRQYHAA